MPELLPIPSSFTQRDLPKNAAPDAVESLLLTYGWMFLARITDERILDLFRQGKVAGTVTGGQGNEGLIVPLTLLANKEIDCISLTHRGLGGHLIWGKSLPTLLAQYFANEFSPTWGREGNIHHGEPANRSYPMISHLGSMGSNVVGATDSQRRNGLPAVGIVLFGDGASSTGDVHETMNWAARFQIPILFVIENNGYAYSTPTREQYAVQDLVSRAEGYGMPGLQISTSDTAETLLQMSQALQQVRESGKPMLLEVHTLRLRGHAAYDTCEYIPLELQQEWEAKDPLPALRKRLISLGKQTELEQLEKASQDYLEASLKKVYRANPPSVEKLAIDVFCQDSTPPLKLPTPQPSSATLNFADAVREAQRRLLAEDPKVIVMGQDIAEYGGAFRTTAGLVQQFGHQRVINTPLAESCMIGYATGLALNGHRPIVEFQFADFATDATTQITLNAATYHFRSGASVPLVLRFPCGGGLTFGSFHSQDLEALYLHMPGLKVLYPSTPNDVYHALIAAWADPNPVLVFEHKGLYRKAKGLVDFSQDSNQVWTPRKVRSGSLATVLTWGEMVPIMERVLDHVEEEYEEGCDLIDARSLCPFDWSMLEDSLMRTGKLVVVHEARRDGGRGAEIVAEASERYWNYLQGAPLRIGAQHTPVPFAPNLEQWYRPTEESITNQLFNWLEQVMN
jgi:2-oxoisovalerate dehydrogenase E1 component